MYTYKKYQNAAAKAKKLGLIVSKYGKFYGKEKYYCGWNKTGDRSEKEKIYCEYIYINGKAI